jgi:predicted NUDIX family phosphoesterase
VNDVSAERVLVVPTELFRRLGYFQGFNGDVDRYLDQLLSPQNVSYRPRHQVEHDPSFKQLIPYMIFRFRDADAGEFLFQYTRGRGMGEGRLHQKRSVGIGGHVSAIDAESANALDPYEAGMRRELAEEVVVESPYTSKCIGLINDDRTEVGSVHLGVVYLFDLERPSMRPREEDIIDGSFRPVDAILSDLPGFETWSQICMEALYGGDG